MKPIITFLCAVLLTLASQVSAQNMSTSFVAVPLPGQPPYPVGSKMTIDLNVSNFTNVASILLPVTYNGTILRFDSINNHVLPGFTETTPVSHPNPGVIKIAWFPSLIDYPNGYTVAGTNTRLLTIHFTVIGNGNVTVNLSTTVPFTPIEVINASGNIIFNNTIFQSGGSAGNGSTQLAGNPPPITGFKIIANDVYAKQGNRVCVPVTVNDFDSLILLQYAMHWDNTKLNYECVRGAVSPIIPTFNAPVAAPGTLLLQWEDPNLISGIGVSKSDGTRIYEVCFNAIGAPGTESNITIDGFGFGFPPDFVTDFGSGVNAAGQEKWVVSGPNGSTGVAAKVFIIGDAPSGAPLTFTADQDVVAPAMQTCVDMKVKNFTNITEAEFALTYDATKLSFVAPVTIPATALNLLASQVTHSVTGNNGTVKFKWSNAAGVTLADNTTIFSLCFNATGAAGSVVPINFATTACPNPTPFAAFKKTTGGAPYKLENGQVTIMSSVGVPVLTAVAPLCNLGATGSINCNPGAVAATAYAWSYNNLTTQNIVNVPAGTYTVTVTYGAAGTATATATLTPPVAITMTQTAVGVNCFGDSNGSINITPSGGTGAYTYNWVGPMGFTATTQDLTGVKTGNYLVSITDANGCIFASQAVNVPQPAAISVPSNGIVITSLACFGNSNGGINITPQGGTAPYTYDWSNDGPENPDNDPKNITGLPAGTYTVTITDSKGCSFTPSAFTLTAPAELKVNFVKKENVKCFDTPTGAAEISIAGGTGTMTYSWKTIPGNVQVSTDKNPTNLMPGDYNVTVTDANSCTATLPAVISIANPPAALNISGTTTPGVCFGQANGSIDLTVTGGWGNYSYVWSNQLGSVGDVNPVPPGTYTVTVTDNGQCAGTATVNVGGPQFAISIGMPVVSNVSCFGQGNGGICITPSGGNGAPFTVAWSNTPLTGACIGNLDENVYIPTVTDTMGCTAVFPDITVNAPDEILLDTTVTPANPMGGIDLSVTGGTPFTTNAPYTYLWSNNAATEDISGMPAGTYTVTVTDANGCSKIGVYSIANTNVFVDPNSVVVSSIQHACGNDGCINLTISGAPLTVSPFTISWGVGGSLPASTDPTPSICGLSAGTYVITVTASNGNTKTITAQVNPLEPASFSAAFFDPIDEFQNGEITITPGGSNPNPDFSYIWNTGETTATISSLDSGLYIVTVTNNLSGCTAVFQRQLVRKYLPYGFALGQIINPSCAASNNGSISISVTGGNGPNYIFSWTGPNGYTKSEEDIAGLKPGVYNLTVTDESGVTKTHGPFTLTASSNLVITNVDEQSFTPGGTQVSGADICDGEAEVLFAGQTGNVTIQWSNGLTTATNSSLCGGVYSVTVTDSQGCSATWSDALTAPAPIGSTSAGTSPKCFGDTNGAAKVFPSGGIEPYKVLWSNGHSDQLVFANSFSEAINLAGGTYTVTITDANFVTKTATVTVPVAQQISATFTGVDPSNFNSCDGERIVFVTGATAPIIYNWSGIRFGAVGETERAEGLCSGEVLQYLITDANNCSVSLIDTIPYPEDGCFLVRPVLTPAEQDGNNDYTLITCAESAAHTVEIYNRWGQLVFQTDNYTNDPGDPDHTWIGKTRSGQDLPEGVYYYVLTFMDDQGNQHQRKGYINLLK